MITRLIRKGTPAPVRPTGPTYAAELLERARRRIERSARKARGSTAWALAASAVLDEESEDGLPGYRDQSPEARGEFARAWLHFVLENDGLPLQAQMDAEELRKPRGLLAAFFFGVSDIQREAHAVMQMIDERFRGGRIRQAALLLSLFETDEVTRRNNERNLFYEEMIAAFLSAAAESRSGTAPSAGADIARVAEWARETRDVDLLVPWQSAELAESWRRALSASGVDASTPFPPPAWRCIADVPPDEQLTTIALQVARNEPADHVARLLRAFYFLALATGRLGAEETMLRWLDWLPHAFGGAPMRLLPEVHQRVAVDDEPLGATLRVAVATHLGPPRFDRLAWDADRIRSALDRVAERLRQDGLRTVPAGSYDLGGLLFDELLGFEPTSVEDSLRLYRLA
jgi:hypothetical protein